MGKAIIMFLIPVVFAVLGIFIISTSKTPEVSHKPAAYGPGTGYSQVPEEYTVTASTSYKWHHGTKSTALIIAGFVFFLASGVYVYWVDKEVQTFNRWALAICWVLGMACIFGKHVTRYYERGKFERTISAEQYEQNKGDLDAIFLQ